MVKGTIGLDAAGNVVDDLELAVKVIESEHDDEGNLESETIYIKHEE